MTESNLIRLPHTKMAETRHMFDKELQFFIAHQDELVSKHQGKVLVIKGERLIGVYQDTLEAYFEAQKEHKLGTFMIQPCEPGPEAYTVTISSPYVYV